MTTPKSFACVSTSMCRSERVPKCRAALWVPRSREARRRTTLGYPGRHLRRRVPDRRLGEVPDPHLPRQRRTALRCPLRCLTSARPGSSYGVYDTPRLMLGSRAMSSITDSGSCSDRLAQGQFCSDDHAQHTRRSRHRASLSTLRAASLPPVAYAAELARERIIELRAVGE